VLPVKVAPATKLEDKVAANEPATPVVVKESATTVPKVVDSAFDVTVKFCGAALMSMVMPLTALLVVVASPCKLTVKVSKLAHCLMD
jgi:lipopolysaccharide/colanic/teichoic acid biosynthesis glycosyltransferase